MKRQITAILVNLKASSTFSTKSLIKRTVTSKKHPEIPHAYFKWNYQPLPTQTILDETNPQFNVRPPEFKLPNKRGRLPKREWRQRAGLLQQARHDPELERLARNRQLMLPLDEINQEWRKEYGLYELNSLSKFYGINKDLFHTDEDIAKIWLGVALDNILIHRGNILEAKQLQTEPSIQFEGNDDRMYTILLTNIDGHPLDSTKEVVHWMKCNIVGSNIQNGTTIYDFLPLLPWKGTGYHRVVCVLYEQEHEIDGEKIKPSSSSLLAARSFSSSHFQAMNNCTPVSMAFCQVSWDESVSENIRLLKDLTEEPLFGWEDYIEPIHEQQILRQELSEMKYRNM